MAFGEAFVPTVLDLRPEFTILAKPLTGSIAVVNVVARAVQVSFAGCRVAARHGDAGR